MLMHQTDWQGRLLQLQKMFLGAFPDLTIDESTKMNIIMNRMQEDYPGNYTLKWKYESKRGLMLLFPHFKNPVEGTFWKLKFST